MNEVKMTRSFQVQIYGLSGEKIEVQLCVATQRALQVALRSFFSNILQYLSTHLALSKDHLYVFLNVG